MNADKVIVVIGFPKSGNTWVSRIVRQLYDGVIYNELDNKIDKIVYELYELSEKEIKIIEK